MKLEKNSKKLGVIGVAKNVAVSVMIALCIQSAGVGTVLADVTAKLDPISVVSSTAQAKTWPTMPAAASTQAWYDYIYEHGVPPVSALPATCKSSVHAMAVVWKKAFTGAAGDTTKPYIDKGTTVEINSAFLVSSFKDKVSAKSGTAVKTEDKAVGQISVQAKPSSTVAGGSYTWSGSVAPGTKGTIVENGKTYNFTITDKKLSATDAKWLIPISGIPGVDYLIKGWETGFYHERFASELSPYVIKKGDVIENNELFLLNITDGYTLFGISYICDGAVVGTTSSALASYTSLEYFLACITKVTGKGYSYSVSGNTVVIEEGNFGLTKSGIFEDLTKKGREKKTFSIQNVKTFNIRFEGGNKSLTGFEYNGRYGFNILDLLDIFDYNIKGSYYGVENTVICEAYKTGIAPVLNTARGNNWAWSKVSSPDALDEELSSVFTLKEFEGMQAANDFRLGEGWTPVVITETGIKGGTLREYEYGQNPSLGHKRAVTGFTLSNESLAPVISPTSGGSLTGFVAPEAHRKVYERLYDKLPVYAVSSRLGYCGTVSNIGYLKSYSNVRIRSLLNDVPVIQYSSEKKNSAPKDTFFLGFVQDLGLAFEFDCVSYTSPLSSFYTYGWSEDKVDIVEKGWSPISKMMWKKIPIHPGVNILEFTFCGVVYKYPVTITETVGFTF
jgi:hypothetical protein